MMRAATRAVHRCIRFTGLFIPIAVSAQQTVPVRSRETLVSARRLLESGSYRDAETMYSGVLQLLPASDSVLRAAAHFGRAFAAQQRYVTGDTADRRVNADSLVFDYRQAAALNPRALGTAANNNIAVVLGAAGRSRDAARAFVAVAGGGAKVDRAASLLSAGREFEKAQDTDSAAAAYRSSLAIDPRNSEALRALLELLVRTRPAGELLKVVGQYQDTASARVVSDALVLLLIRPQPTLDPAEAAEATVQLARTWPRMRMGTPYFDVALREPLGRAAEMQPSVRGALLSMIEAYSLRPQNAPFRESGNAAWWHTDDGSPNGRRAAWSSLLRSIGDWHSQQGSLNVARSYYEGAIGLKERSLNSPSIDRSALLPLALIYAQVSDTSSSARLHTELRDFTDVIFSAKGQAYRTGDLEQIRDFHTTLGALYAARGEWTGLGAQNAEFQLEHMRQATRSLGERSQTVLVDPPDLLEKLAIHYKMTGRPDSVASVKRDIIKQYDRLKRPDEGRAAAKRIDTAKTVPKSEYRNESAQPRRTP